MKKLIYTLILLTCLLQMVSCKKEDFDFENITFESKEYIYDGEYKSVAVEGIPNGATITYTPSNTYKDVGVYDIEATISKKGYNEYKIASTLTIKENNFENITFESKKYIYDGTEKRIEISNLPSGAEVTYNPTNTYTEIGTYEIEAIVSKEGYKDLKFNATLIITYEEVTITYIDNIFTEKINAIKYKKANEKESLGKTGYIFKYWTYEGVEFNFDTLITDDITLIAYYEYDEELKYPFELELTGKQKIYEGDELELNIEVMPSIALENVYLESSNEEIAKVEGYKIKGINAGKCTIYLKSKYDNVSTEIEIRVIEGNRDLKGYEIVIDYGATYPNGFSDEYLEVIKGVEEDYNCKITLRESNYSADSIFDYPEIYESFKSGDYADLVGSFSFDFLFSHYVDYTIDITDYLDKYKPALNYDYTNIMESYNGRNYGISLLGNYKGGIAYFLNGIMYRTDLLDEYNIVDPAKLFNEGKWDYDSFCEWCIDTKNKLGDDYNFLDHILNDFYTGLLNSAGEVLIDRETNTFSVRSERIDKVIEFINRLVDENIIDEYDYLKNKIQCIGNTDFLNEKGFAIAGNVYECYMWRSNTGVFQDGTLGYVPLPYGNDQTKDDVINGITCGTTKFVFLKNREKYYPEGVDFDDIFFVMSEIADRAKEIVEDYSANKYYAERYSITNPESIKIIEWLAENDKFKAEGFKSPISPNNLEELIFNGVDVEIFDEQDIKIYKLYYGSDLIIIDYKENNEE